MKKLLLLTSLIIATLAWGRYQIFEPQIAVGDPQVKPEEGAAFIVQTTEQTSLPCPKMTETQRDALATTPIASCVYNSTAAVTQFWNGSDWIDVGSQALLAEWQTGTAYGAGAFVYTTPDFKLWVANTAHTAGATFAGDIANWDEASDDLNRLSSSTDNAIPRFDGTGGDDVQDSSVLIDDSDNITGVNDITTVNDIVSGNDISSTGSITSNTDLTVVGDTTLDTALTGILRADSGVVSSLDDPLPIANGGTNSSTALTNNNVMFSQGNSIRESSLTLNGAGNLGGINNLTVTGDSTFDSTLDGLGYLTSGALSSIADGTNGQLLTMDAGSPAWLDAPVSTTLTTKGDIQGYDGTSNVRIPVGTDGQVLTADSGATEGVSYQDVAATLQDTYDNSADGSILLDPTRDGLQINDASSPILASLFAVLNNAGTTTYFNVAQDGVSTDIDINMNGTGGFGVASGTTAQRPVASAFKTRGNTDENCKEHYNSVSGEWDCETTVTDIKGENFIYDASFEKEELTFDVNIGKSDEDYPTYFEDALFYEKGTNEKFYRVYSNSASSEDVEFTLSVDRDNLDDTAGYFFMRYATPDDLTICIKIDGGTDCEEGTIVEANSDDSFHAYEIPSFIFGASSVEIVFFEENATGIKEVKVEHMQMKAARPFSTINDSDTDWISYTPTFTGFGTVSTQEFEYKRVGDSVIIRGNFTCGTPTATEAQITLPNSAEIKSGVGISSSGAWFRGGSARSTNGGSLLITGSDSFVNFSSTNVFSDTASDPISAVNGNNLCASGDTINFTTAQIPIEGWQTGRVDAFSQKRELPAVTGSGNGGTSLTADVTNIDFTEVEDDLELWDGSVFTADREGYYDVSGMVRFSSSVSAAIDMYVKEVGGSFVKEKRISNFLTGGRIFNGIVKLEKNEEMAIRVSNTATLSNESDHNIQIQYFPTFGEVIAQLKASQIKGACFNTTYSETEIECGMRNGEMVYRICQSEASTANGLVVSADATKLINQFGYFKIGTSQTPIPTDDGSTKFRLLLTVANGIEVDTNATTDAEFCVDYTK